MTYPDHAVAVVSGSVDGEYVVTVNNKNYTVAVSGGTGSVDIDVLPVGSYTAVVTANIPNYNPVSEYDTFKVVNGIINVHIEVNDTVYPNHPIANVTATLDGDYVIVVTLINSNSSSTNKTFNIHVADGKAIVDLGRLDAGNYSATVTGDIEGYSIVSDTDEFEVKKANPCLDAISSPKNPVYNQDNIHIDPLLPSDATGTVTYIVDDNKPITLGLNETFKFTPDKAGKHKIVVIYNGDNNYLTDNMTLYVNVLKADTPMNINTDKSKHVTGDKIKVIVNLPKGATGTVTYYLNGKKMATLPVGEIFEFTPIGSGQYTITAFYSGDENYKSNYTTMSIYVGKSHNKNNSTIPEKMNSIDLIPATGNPILLLILMIMMILGVSIRRKN